MSQRTGRDGESFVSPDEQRERIRTACERDGLQLIRVVDELDISGGRSLDERPGLGPAVRAAETGEAEVIAAAYFDRLFRSLTVQAEVVERVERAGGRVLAVDVGRVTNGSAAQWLSGTMLDAVSEYARRTVAERSAEAQRRAVARGVVPWPRVPPGYLRGEDGALVPDPDTAPTIAVAFAMRAQGAAVNTVRDHLRRHGIDRSFHGVTSLLKSRVVLGEIHFGDLVNLEAHEPIVARDVWQAVQRVTVPRGRRSRSDRLLARLGVLRCATCGARMVVGTSNRSRYWIYRCPPNGAASGVRRSAPSSSSGQSATRSKPRWPMLRAAHPPRATPAKPNERSSGRRVTLTRRSGSWPISATNRRRWSASCSCAPRETRRENDSSS